eukprot:7030884-Alexandrium_andersonii.AAC.1
MCTAPPAPRRATARSRPNCARARTTLEQPLLQSDSFMMKRSPRCQLPRAAPSSQNDSFMMD